MLRKRFASTLAVAFMGVCGAIGYGVDQKAPAAPKNQPVQLAQAAQHRTSPFKGAKANTGYAIHQTLNGRQVLSVSEDFVIPNTPAPSWQVVDSSGNVYLLNQFKIKDGRTNRQITLPTYIPDVQTVQVWCSFAEVLLGEASFEMAVK
jgi:hypothetical protein